MIFDYGGWRLDISTIYMMSICKFSSIAFSYEDGGIKDEEIKSSYHKHK
jgi:lysophospholipid acyltransferase